MNNAAQKLLYELISQQSPDEAVTWLDQQAGKYRSQPNNRIFNLTFSTIVRHFEKADLTLNDKTLQRAEQIRSGWDLSQWDVRQAARTYWLLQLSADSFEEYRKVLDRLFATADMDEQVTLYAALPLYDYSDQMAYRASEGIRTNITDVFDAVALRNPYPAEYMSDEAWNQMVLKAIFMGRPLYLIQQLDERRNPDQARMLIDFAHERWAASRPVTPELWRGVAPYLTEEHLPNIQRLLEQGDKLEKQAAALAIKESENDTLNKQLANYPQSDKELDWKTIGIRYND
ncbi:EboA domain-containing protein [Tunicatimonas pelagia]|uniref:EboA domain-containing protein n=1 Tax=Tunicatimonas pelagia TaxID=931531 RepID=UPI00266697A3|nr:EboA domain-containing protein [Tunicatimonas pelagia]WKN41844.1 EboA domain-containing protein [Tunicatimonas pelagia]